MAQGLPLCVYDPLPGQEERNAEFLSQAGVAVQVDTEKDLVAQVNRMLQDPGYLATASAAAKKLAKPNAARDIANLLETLLLNFSCQSLGHIGV